MHFRWLTRLFRRHCTRTCTSSPLGFAVLLLILLLIQWLQHKHLTEKKKEVSETLTIYRQMLAYSKDVCNAKPTEEDTFIRGPVVRVDKEMVKNEVTFILISQPDMGCANDLVKVVTEKYPSAKVVLAFQSKDIMPKDPSILSKRFKFFPFVVKSVNLGGYDSYPEALQTAISLVKTKYFMVYDSQLAVNELEPGLVEKLLTNFHGFDVLGGSQINNDNEFFIPCHSLKLRNWTFFEKFEYHTSGNVLHCESTSLHFLGRTESFQKVLEHEGFDSNTNVLWRQDFFLRVKGLLVVGTLPEVIFKNSVDTFCQRVKAPVSNIKKERIDVLLPFVNKHHVLNFINPNAHETTICNGTDPLICSEKYIFPKWKLKHWAYSGLTAFPFITERLIDALHFGTAQLEKNRIKYILEGGTLLGFIKVRAVLPWDSGDVDTFVFSNRRTIINLVKKIRHDQGYEYKLRYNAFHVYVTPYYPTHDGLIVYQLNRNDPEELIKIRLHGKLFPVPRTMFKFVREYYGPSYLESRIRFGDERVSCDYQGYQACMPDCRWDGCGSGRSQFPGILL